MKRLMSKARVAVCLIVVLTFFLSAYRGVSGYRFLSMALAEPDSGSQLTLTDALIAVLPLLLVPATALALLLRSLQRIPVRRVYTALPLLFLLFFTGILFWSERNDPSLRSVLDLPGRMQAGFYLGYLACVVLPLTRNRKRKRRRAKKTDAVAEAVA